MATGKTARGYCRKNFTAVFGGFNRTMNPFTHRAEKSVVLKEVELNGKIVRHEKNFLYGAVFKKVTLNVGDVISFDATYHKYGTGEVGLSHPSNVKLV